MAEPEAAAASVANAAGSADAERHGAEMNRAPSARRAQVGDVHQVAMPNGAAADRHQRAERERVERLVQHDDEEHRQTCPSRAGPSRVPASTDAAKATPSRRAMRR